MTETDMKKASATAMVNPALRPNKTWLVAIHIMHNLSTANKYYIQYTCMWRWRVTKIAFMLINFYQPLYISFLMSLCYYMLTTSLYYYCSLINKRNKLKLLVGPVLDASLQVHIHVQ